MRVALVHRDLHDPARGGICTLYLALAGELTRAGHDVTLITQQTPNPVRRSDLTVINLPRTDDLTRHRAAVTEVLDGLDVDVAECSTWEAELLDYAQRPRAHRVPVLVRGDLSAATMRAPRLVPAEQQLCHVADTVMAVSHFAADDLTAAYRLPTRPTVIANGVDRTRFTPTGHTRPRSGWQVTLDRTGTVTHRRPLADALADDAAWASYFRTPTRGSDATARRPVEDDALPRLVWVGKLTEMKGFDRLQRLAALTTGHARLLIVLGHGLVQYPVDLPPDVLICQDLDTADMAAVYRASDWLLSTSRWEGYGLAIAEALACGTPALLPCDLAVVDELITVGVTGRTWTTTTDVARILAEDHPPLTGALPPTYTWATAAAATVAAYHALTAPTALHTTAPALSRTVGTARPVPAPAGEVTP